MKVVHYHGLVELVQSVRGPTGGIRSGRKPAEIRLGSVVRLTEPDFNRVECFDAAHGRCVLSPSCTLKNALACVREAYLARLDQVIPIPSHNVPNEIDGFFRLARRRRSE